MEFFTPILVILSVMTFAGFNFSFWLMVGVIRWVVEKIIGRRERNVIYRYIKYKATDIGAIIPAHNEELTIARTLNALLKILPKENIYVASDYSTDRTVDIVKSYGVKYLDINPNLGKAKAIVHTIKTFNLFERYKLIMINDADSEVHPDYFKYALPKLNDPEVAAVATHAITRDGNYDLIGRYLVAYRKRLWRILQLGMRFGQTWKYTNVSFIIPGSLSIYRTEVIKQLEIDAPGLIIEDFNMTFEVHKKKLGKIAYSPKIIGIHQDPYTIPDYVKQVQRWNVGFFQTVKRHGFWPSLFWLATTSYYVELLFFAFFIGLLPLIIVQFALNGFEPIDIPFITGYIRFTDLLIGVFFMDYLTTIIAAYFERKPSLLIYGLGFIFIRYIETLVYLGSPIAAWFTNSSGRWVSPKRS